MHAITSERRATGLARMPITMSVELGHDGWEETYEADAVNLSSSGIGVRAPMLPDVGQRLRCRFRVPELAAPCEAEGEVAWASDAGDAGEFGIRFDALDPAVGEVLARWVASVEGLEDADPDAPRRPRVKVQLDGVASPIEAEVSVAEGRRVRVEQPLPFLLLGTKATVSGEDAGLRRVLRSVELKIDGAVPRLVLELEDSRADGAEGTDGEGSEGPSTMVDQPVEALLGPALSRASIEPIADDPETPVDVAIPEPAPAPRARRHERVRREDDAAQVVGVERDALAELGVTAAPEDDEEEASLGARLREVGERAGPTLGRLVAALKAGWAALVAGTGPKLRALGVWIARLARALQSTLAARWPALRERLAALRPGSAPKRRVTTAPPELEDRKTARAKRSEAAPELTPSRPKVPLRFVLAGGAVLVATALVVAAFGGESEEPAPLAHEPTLAIEDEAPSAPAEAPAPASPIPLEPPPAVAAATPPSPPVLPGTLAASSTEAGRLGAPTFPRVGEIPAASPASTPVEAPAEPEAEPLPRPGGSLSFGAADVPHGRTTTLTMSLPITAIEGESSESGFTVNLPGVNSLSRAAPIAAANPSVERAAILNSGDHAVLTVRFVPGRTPAYRVEARGSELVVTIGR